MDMNEQKWKQYYEKALGRSHHHRTERAALLNRSGSRVAVDCGCGTGSDIAYLCSQDYVVHGFDLNFDAVNTCLKRFANALNVHISQSGFEDFDYPSNGLVIANSSLYFADPKSFEALWFKIENSISDGGVFAGDFMGIEDSWATGFRCPTLPLTRDRLEGLLKGFKIASFDERNEVSKTALGVSKRWHTYSVIAQKY